MLPIHQHLISVRELPGGGVSVEAIDNSRGSRVINHLVNAGLAIGVHAFRLDLVPTIGRMFKVGTVENSSAHIPTKASTQILRLELVRRGPSLQQDGGLLNRTKGTVIP